METTDILLPDAPNFSRYLIENFEGTVEVAEVKEVRQGFNSRRNSLLTLVLGPQNFLYTIDEDRFYESQRQFPNLKSYFIGPFYTCRRTKIIFRSPETPSLLEHRRMLESQNTPPDEIETIMEFIKTQNQGELRVYPEEIDGEGRMPMEYKGFGLMVADSLRLGPKHSVILTYGSFATLRNVVGDFGRPYDVQQRGSFFNRWKWMRYDGLEGEIPFP